MIFLDDDDEDFPISFYELLPEFAITEEIRKAFIWASLVRFIGEDGAFMEKVDHSLFSERDKQLAKQVGFLGPFKEANQAIDLSKSISGIVCVPRNTWTETDKSIWVCTLLN